MIALLGLIGLALVITVFIVSVYNGLVAKRVQTENAWAQISVQLKRRYDLIPNLVETVKGYAAHEKETFERVIAARNQAMTANNGGDLKLLAAAEAGLTGALRQLFALVEAYPDLKANQSFLQLQEEITSTENRVAFARQHYNDAVSSYHTSIQQVPGNLIAGPFGFKPRQFFELEVGDIDAASNPPRVSF